MAARTTQNEMTFTFSVSNRAIQKLFNDGNADVRFSVGPNEAGKTPQNCTIGAHKQLLAAISPVFAVMFNGQWKESTSVDVTDDATFDGFSAFLQYFYIDKVTLNDDNVAEVLNLANKYDLPELVASCASFLLEHTNLDNVIECLEAAHRFELKEITKRCTDIVAIHTLKVIKSDKFLQCSNGALFDILSANSSSCTEEEIFDACIEWARANCKQQGIDATKMENLREMLGKCFDLIRFAEMQPAARNERLVHYDDMFTKANFLKIITHPRPIVLTRYREPSIFKFNKASDSQQTAIIMADPVNFMFAAQIKLVAFNLSKAAATTAFGEIDNNFTGTITIDTRDTYSTCTQTSHNYNINRHKNFDNDGDYCFKLTPVAILKAKNLYSIQIYPRMTSFLGEFYVQPQSVGGVKLTPYGAMHGSHPYQQNQLATCFSALHFEKV